MKKSIFWNLPYWANVKLRHNLDVMHIEKNIFENVFNTMMDVKGKTKDNDQRWSLELIEEEEHLPIHVADEVLLAGPVHYRWMYPFERFIYRLKNMVGNKSQVAASIVSAYLQLEITFLGSDYLGPEYKTKIWELRGHYDILQWVHDISLGFDHKVECTNTYKINNYRFCIEGFNEGKRKTCCQLQLKVQGGGYFYGVIKEIINMKCRHSEHLKFVLFKCRWFDPRHVLSTPSTGIVEVNSNRVYQPYDPFILAQQAEQVYFIDFPGQPQRTSQGWLVVCRVKPNNAIDLSVADIPFQDDGGTSSDLSVVEQMNDVGDLADDVVEEYNPEDVSEDSNNSVPEDTIDKDNSELESE
ncbi:hypothetical protein QQ045_025384 [Rhodiola kirilowii]